MEYILKFFNNFLEVVEKGITEAEIKILYADIIDTECMDDGIDMDKLFPELAYGFGEYLLRINVNGELIDIGFDTKDDRDKVLSFVTK